MNIDIHITNDTSNEELKELIKLLQLIIATNNEWLTTHK